MNVPRLRLKRAGILAGFVGATVAAALVVVPATASAANPPVGAQPGAVSLNPASGPLVATAKPTFTTTTACPAAFQSNAKLLVVKDSGVTTALSPAVNVPVNVPFTGTLSATLAQLASTAGFQANHTYEFVVQCLDAQLNPSLQQSTFVTISSDATSYTSSATPPAGGVATTTTLTANPPTQTQGGNVDLTATVVSGNTPSNDAVGSVEFDNGATSLGTAAVAGGTATLSLTTLPVGADSITAKFIPTDSNAFAASVSGPTTVTITQGPPPPGAETLNVLVGDNTSGRLSLDVDNTTPVSISSPVSTGTDLEGTGTLNNVTVHDTRQPTVVGWALTGAVSDFTGTTKAGAAVSFSGNALGWTPAVKTPNAANDVTAGGKVASNAPGLGSPASLASAAAGKGFGDTVLNAALDLHIPVTQAAAQYSATETNTLISN